MREIFFRGKILHKGQWVEGHLVTCKNNGRTFITELIEVDEDSWLYWEVDPSTVGQYTCLTDKNGTKIFEGDILSTNSTVLSKLIVHWFERCGGFFLSDSKDIDASSLTPIYSVNLCKYVVIGNIYDNPELAKI